MSIPVRREFELTRLAARERRLRLVRQIRADPPTVGRRDARLKGRRERPDERDAPRPA